MDRKSKILILIFVLVTLVSIFFTYKRSFVDRNFIILEGEDATEEEAGEEAEEVTEEAPEPI